MLNSFLPKWIVRLIGFEYSSNYFLQNFRTLGLLSFPDMSKIIITQVFSHLDFCKSNLSLDAYLDRHYRCVSAQKICVFTQTVILVGFAVVVVVCMFICSLDAPLPRKWNISRFVLGGMQKHSRRATVFHWFILLLSSRG